MFNTISAWPWRFAGIIGLFIVAGCSTGQPRAGVIDNKVIDYQKAYKLDTEDAVQLTEAPLVLNELGLVDALSMALQSHPALSVSYHDVDAAKARVLQEGMWLNPTLGVELENFGGSGEFEGFDASETTVVLSQTFELGGKRSTRTNVATYDAMLAEWDYVITWLDVVAETSKRFVALQAAVQELGLAKFDVHAAKRIHDAVVERVKSGRDTILEEMKVKSMMASAELSLVRAKNTLNAAKEALSLMWAAHNVRVDSVSSVLENLAILPSLDVLLPLVDSLPEVQQKQLEVQLAEAVVVAARAERIPDLGLAAGYKQSRADEEHMFLAGIEVELPLFNRNQGGVSEALAMQRKAQTELTSMQKEMRLNLLQTHQQISGSHEAVRILDELVLPANRAAFDAAEEGYRAGKYTYLDMLDAQQSLLDAERERVQAHVEYVIDLIELERLLATRLSALQSL